MLIDQPVKSDIEPETPRRRVPRGCRWLLWGLIAMVGLCTCVTIGSFIYVDECGFPYLNRTQAQPSATTDRAVIAADNVSRLTELYAFDDGDSLSNRQPRYQAVFSPSGKWLVSGGAVQWASGYSCASLWLINTNDFSSQVLSLGDGNIPGQILFTPDEQWLFAGAYHRIEAISPSNPSDTYTVADYPPYRGTDLSMELIPNLGDSNMLMVLSNKQVPFFWDYDNRREIVTPLVADIVTTAKRAGDYIAYGTADGDAKLYRYNVDENKTIRLLEAEDPVSIVFNHAGTLLKINDQRSSKIFDVATQEILFEIPGSRIPLKFSPHDRYFVTGDGVWTLENRQQILTFEEQAYVFAEFSPQEDLLIMATYKGRIDIWNLNTRQIAFSIENDYTMSDVGFNPAQTLITASFDGSDRIGPGILKVWGVPSN